MSKTSMHVQINVTRNCLLEFLDILDQNSCHDICVTYSDYGWHVQYDSPFTREPVKGCDESVKEDGHPIPVVPSSCKYCVHLNNCLSKPIFKFCDGEFFLKALPMESEIVVTKGVSNG